MKLDEKGSSRLGRGESGLEPAWIPCLAVAMFMSAAVAQSPFPYAGCADVTEADFKYTQLVAPTNAKSPKLVDQTLSEPLKIAIDTLSDKSVDIYIVQRNGKLRKYNTASNTNITVGTLPSVTTNDMGFTSLALDPDFHKNHQIFVYYSASGPYEFHLSRVTLNDAHTQFKGAFTDTEKRLITIAAVAGKNHTGSGMAFDSYGDLWINIGKNAPDYVNSYSETDQTMSSENTSSNTADLRGSVLRIHPDNSARGYSIPDGNYGAYWADQFQASKPDLAAQYRDTSKVKAEVYVKGMRNPYSLSVHPTKRWASVGMFNVNTTAGYTETHYLFTHPGFAGYPYFTGGGTGHALFPLWSNTGFGQNGNNVWKTAHGSDTEDPLAPVNNSKWNGGPKQLPPVTAALHTYLHDLNTSHYNGAGGIGGPIYQYVAGGAAYKLPPHFQNAWFTTDYVQGNSKGIRVFKLNDAGTQVLDSLALFTGKGWLSFPLDFVQGPDGGLYVANYGDRGTSLDGTGIGRIEYTGNCSPTVSLAGASSPEHTFSKLTGNRLEVSEAAYTLVIRDVHGRELRRVEGHGPKTYALRDLLPKERGLLLITVSGAHGTGLYKLFPY